VSFGLPLEEERRWRERNLFALYSTINELLIEEEAISLKFYNKNERITSIFQVDCFDVQVASTLIKERLKNITCLITLLH